MANVVIYSKEVCPFCVNAKEFFNSRNVEYTEISVDSSPDKLQEMLQKSGGRRTVPQIFINETHVGGFDDLSALSPDELNKLLA